MTIIFDEFLGQLWNRESQDELLRKLVDRGILQPHSEHGTLTDRTALTRIWKKLLETLGLYVIVEIKAGEVSDSAFGQILRYIGWMHRNIPDAKYNVRGIILAGRFPETARYSRIGLLREDHQYFLKFKRHGLYVSDT